MLNIKNKKYRNIEIVKVAQIVMWYCYILRSTDEKYRRRTYNGSTNDLRRRLRQHNEEIKGGARATKGKGGKWEYCAILYGFPDHINALSCEWRIKCPSGRPGKREPRYNGPSGRVRSLNEILPLPRWTGRCEVDNSETIFYLEVLKEYASELKEENIPENIIVMFVDDIDVNRSEEYKIDNMN